jgi:hypothetical protein
MIAGSMAILLAVLDNSTELVASHMLELVVVHIDTKDSKCIDILASIIELQADIEVKAQTI